MDNYIPTDEDISEIFAGIHFNKIDDKHPDVIDVIYEDKHLKVKDGVNIDIFIDMRCTGNCPFCINKAKEIVLKGKFNKRTDKIISTEEFIQKFDNLYDILNEKMFVKPFINITGGEPTISPRFIPFIQHLLKKKIKFDMISNATNLSNDVLNAMKYNCNMINLSRAHYDDNKNQQLMNLSKKSYNKDIKIANNYIKNNFIQNKIASISCILMKNGIHTVEDIKKYIETYSYLNPQVIMFRQVEDISFYTQNKEEIQQILWKIDWIKDDLLKDIDFKLISYDKFDKGAEVFTFKYKNNNFDTIFIARPDQYVLRDGINNTDIIKRIMFLPNGNIII